MKRTETQERIALLSCRETC